MKQSTVHIRKMVGQVVTGGKPLRYDLPLKADAKPDSETALFPISDQIGNSIRLSFDGKINCIKCGRATKKSFNQCFCKP